MNESEYSRNVTNNNNDSSISYYEQMALWERRKLADLHESILKNNKKLNLASFANKLTCFNLNSLDSNNQTLLHKAIVAENFALTALLVEKGAELNTVDVNGHTPLSSAVQSNSLTMTRYLIDNGSRLDHRQDDDDGDENHQDANSNSSCGALARYLCEFLDKIDSRISAANKNQIVRSALHQAIHSSSSYKIVRLLLEKGANPNEIDHNNNNNTPLHVAAAKKKCSRLVSLLHKHGANANIITENTFLLPLHVALASSDLTTCELLFEFTSKTRLNTLDFQLQTPMDRLWERLNGLKLSQKSPLTNKLHNDKILKGFQSLIKRFILAGAQMNKYLYEPHQCSPFNDYIISNVICLLKATLSNDMSVRRRDDKAYEAYLSPLLKWIMFKLAIKYTYLRRKRAEIFGKLRHTMSSPQPQPSQSSLTLSLNDNKLFLNEFQDLVHDLRQFEMLIYMILFNENFKNNRAILNFVMNEYILSGEVDSTRIRVDLGLGEEEDSQLMSYRDYRKCLLTHFYLLIRAETKRPMSLKEASRIQTRAHLFTNDRARIFPSLNLPNHVESYLFYEA